MATENLNAVLDEDLAGLLEAIRELAPIEAGERFCENCHTLITLKTLQMIIPREVGGFTYICDKPECVEASKHLRI